MAPINFNIDIKLRLNFYIIEVIHEKKFCFRSHSILDTSISSSSFIIGVWGPVVPATFNFRRGVEYCKDPAAFIWEGQVPKLEKAGVYVLAAESCRAKISNSAGRNLHNSNILVQNSNLNSLNRPYKWLRQAFIFHDPVIEDNTQFFLQDLKLSRLVRK